MPVIDISTTALAVYQISGVKPEASPEDADVNLKLTGGFDYTRGLISCAPFKTSLNANRTIVLLRRKKSGMCGVEDWNKRHKKLQGIETLQIFRTIKEEEARKAEMAESLTKLARKVLPPEQVTYFVPVHQLESVRNCTNLNTTDIPIVKICSPASQNKVLVTLFTTMHDSAKNHYIYKNVIHLHSLLKPRLQPMLFVSSPVVEKQLVKLACSLGWHVLTAPTCDRNKLPVLKDMFLAAEIVQESNFYGYANGDIVFDESLIETLVFMDSIKQHFKEALFVGSRTNIQVKNTSVKYHCPG